MSLDPIQQLERIAAALKSFSDQGSHMRIPGPSSGYAYEMGLEIEMCIAALAAPFYAGPSPLTLG